MTILARIAELERAIVEIARAHPHAPRLAAMEYAITDIANAANLPHLRKLFEGELPPVEYRQPERVVYVEKVVHVDRPVVVERVIERTVEAPPIVARRPRSPNHGRTQTMIADYVRNNPGATASRTAAALGIAYEHTSATLKLLRDRGKVRREGNHAFRYYWTDDDGD